MLPSDVVSHLAYSIVLVPEVLPTLDELEASANIARGRFPREWWARSRSNRRGVEARGMRNSQPGSFFCSRGGAIERNSLSMGGATWDLGQSLSRQDEIG